MAVYTKEQKKVFFDNYVSIVKELGYKVEIKNHCYTEYSSVEFTVNDILYNVDIPEYVGYKSSVYAPNNQPDGFKLDRFRFLANSSPVIDIFKADKNKSLIAKTIKNHVNKTFPELKSMREKFLEVDKITKNKEIKTKKLEKAFNGKFSYKNRLNRDTVVCQNFSIMENRKNYDIDIEDVTLKQLVDILTVIGRLPISYNESDLTDL